MRWATESIGFDYVELQPEAMKALIKARQEAQKENLDITPRDGAKPRGATTRIVCASGIVAFFRLSIMLQQERLTLQQVEQMRTLPLHDQVAECWSWKRAAFFQQRSFKIDFVLDCSARHFSAHCNARV